MVGIFSISLNVSDIKASKEFYENLGFEVVPECGSVEEKWLMMQNGGAKIGLFEGMFPNNIITFNPEDARSIYKKIRQNGVKPVFQSESLKDKESGPCNFSIKDPDGNQILFDQF